MPHGGKRQVYGGYFALRWEVLERDNFTCQYCGQKAPNVLLEIDHIVPVAEGGLDTLENLTTSCAACNRGRSGLSIRRNRGKMTPLISKPPGPLSLRERIQVLLKDNPMTYQEIAASLGAKPETVAVNLSRHRKLFAKGQDRKWISLTVD